MNSKFTKKLICVISAFIMILCTVPNMTALADNPALQPDGQSQNKIQPRLPTNYDQGDVGAINKMIDNNGLVATKNDPDSWDFATWDSPSIGKKRLLGLVLSEKNLTGTLDLSAFSELQIIYCGGNQFSGTLDVSNNPALSILDCYNNEFSGTLDLSNNPALTTLNCANNKFTGINVTGLKNLQIFHCADNLMKYKTDIIGLDESILLDFQDGGLLDSTNNNGNGGFGGGNTGGNIGNIPDIFGFGNFTNDYSDFNYVENAQNNSFGSDFKSANTLKYAFLSGENQVWNGENDGLSFRIDAPFDSFLSVSVDGKTLSPDNYTAKSGSTIIDLPASYLKTLTAEKHTIRINFNAGAYAETAFSITSTKPSTASSDGFYNPQTGARDTLSVVSAFAMVSLLAAAIVIYIKKINV